MVNRDQIQKDVSNVLFLVGDDVREIVTERVKYLREDKLWGNDDQPTAQRKGRQIGFLEPEVVQVDEFAHGANTAPTADEGQWALKVSKKIPRSTDIMNHRAPSQMFLVRSH